MIPNSTKTTRPVGWRRRWQGDKGRPNQGGKGNVWSVPRDRGN